MDIRGVVESLTTVFREHDLETMTTVCNIVTESARKPADLRLLVLSTQLHHSTYRVQTHTFIASCYKETISDLHLHQVTMVMLW